jgi:hypothetical protein
MTTGCLCGAAAAAAACRVQRRQSRAPPATTWVLVIADVQSAAQAAVLERHPAFACLRRRRRVDGSCSDEHPGARSAARRCSWS